MAVLAGLAFAGGLLVRLLYDSCYTAVGPTMTLIALALIPKVITLSYDRRPLAKAHTARYARAHIGPRVLAAGVLWLRWPIFAPLLES